MQLAPGSSYASWPAGNAHLSSRGVHFTIIAALLVIALGVYTLSPWSPAIEYIDPNNQRFLGRHSSESAFLPQLSNSSDPASPELPASPALVRLPQHLAQSNVPPDPLELPGWREGTKWVTNDPSVQIHHWMQRMIDGQGFRDDLDWARNKTVLLLGDSVLRGWVYHLCADFVEGERNRLTFSDNADVDEKNEGWECVISSTGTRFVNGFVYGMSDYSRVPLSSPIISKDWPVGPWGIEDRIPAIIEQYSKLDVDMIVLNSGAWDLKFMYRRDCFEGRRDPDIDPSELSELGERLRESMRMIKEAWPSSKLTFLQTQPFSSGDTLNRWIWGQDLTQFGGHDWGIDFDHYETESQSVENIPTTLPPMFTRRRVSQLATTYRKVAAEEGWDGLDLWKVAEATEPEEFYPKTDTVHPAVPSVHIIMDFALERLWRWTTYGV